MKFSRSWVSSKNPSKQRKYKANAPLHIKGKFLSSTLDVKLRKEHSMRSLRLRVGDKVQVMRGQHKGKEAKVSKVSIKYGKVYLEGLNAKKVGGTTTPLPFQPSNLKILELDLTDERRIKAGKKQ